MSDIRKEFELCTESYYEGHFTKYETNGDYVSERQQDDFVMFQSGFQAGRAHDIDGLIAEIEELQDLYSAGLYPEYSPSEVNERISGCVHAAIRIIRKRFGKE